MQPLTSFVQLRQDIESLFAYLTNPAHTERIFEHVTRLDNPRHADARHYRQTRLLHGISWKETVDVLTCEPPRRYILRICMFGVETRYAYTLEAIDTEQTWLHLTQTAHGRGLQKILHPLIWHVFSRPEHDGQHLLHLKVLLEQEPNRRQAP